MTPPRILIVDDDTALLQALPEALRLRMDGLDIDTSEAAADALERVRETDYDAIVTDIKMPGMDGLALLHEVRRVRPTTPTLLITGHGEHDLAVQALRGGAYDFVQKPIDRDYFVASLRRAIDRRRLEREVEAQRDALERHARVLEHVGDGVCLIDRQGVVQLWTPAAELITGLEVDQVIGRPIADVFPGWDAIAPAVPVMRADGSGRQSARTVPVAAGGRELWLSLAGVEFADGIVYTFRDLTEERAVEQLKAEFVSTVSHELRTPLAAVYGAALTLRRRDVTPADEQRETLLGVIANEADRLARTVNDILWASRLDSDSLRISIESCDARELAHAVVEAARVHLPEGIELSLGVARGVPPVAGDPDKVRQVLANLVDNAVKYSPDGGRVRVDVGGNGQTGDNHHVRFSVHDEGLGIPPAEQRRIFEKFYRLDPNLTRGVGGTGLGLYICQELIRRMEGRIWVDSREGEGSTFSFELPAAAS